MINEYPVVEFKNSKLWRQFLDKNGTSIDGVWLRIYKKHSGIETVTYAEALDQALCYGWIDGQKKSLDELSYIQKFTPRRQRSIWSKQNIGHIERLTKLGLMMDQGISEVKRAKTDGRWAAAYDKPSEMTVPDDFVKALARYPKAKKFYESLGKSQHYAIAWKLQTARRPETRQRRFDKLLESMKNKQKLV